MGADLILTWLQIDKDKQPDFKAGMDRISELATKNLSEWPKEYVDQRLLDAPDGFDKDKEIEALKLSLRAIEGAWREVYRDMAVIDVCHKKLLITGGMSWGDSPTESYDDIDRMLTSGVSKACGFE